MSSVVCIWPKNPFSVLISQNSSRISRGFLCRTLINRGWIKKKFCHISKNQVWHQSKKNLNLKTLKIFNRISSSRYLQQYTIAHWPWPIELAKLTNLGENRKRLDNTTDPYSAHSTHSYSYEKLNENTDITSKKSFNAETHYRKIFSLEDKPSDTIQIKSTSNPYSKDIFVSNISVDNDAH